jgi:glutamine synthetase
VARRYGVRVSLSPVPFAGKVGSGAHQHFSLRGGDGPLFSGGVGVHGMTAAGESAIAGLLAGLPDAQGALCGSIVSGLRLAPNMWSGAYVCWGTDNREAAARFVPGGAANPCGANVEVKIGDPSANPYFATAAILGLSLNGIERRLQLGPETTVNPALLTDAQRAQAGIRLLPADQGEALTALAGSTVMRDILGNQAVDAIVAVRRYEQETFAEVPADELAEKFRLSWSV